MIKGLSGKMGKNTGALRSTWIIQAGRRKKLITDKKSKRQWTESRVWTVAK